MIRILIISMISILSACATTTPEVVPVIIPPKPFAGNVTRSEIMQCPEPVRKSVYINLKSRDQYIETLLNVMKAHNGDVQ